MDQFGVYVVRPKGYIHIGALQELAETVSSGLRQIGCGGQMHDGDGSDMGSNAAIRSRCVIIGGHLLTWDQLPAVPTGWIVYNTEQFGAGYHMNSPAYQRLMQTYETWDVQDQRRLVDQIVPPENQPWKYRHVPVGYVPEMTRIEPAVLDIDVLFYGSSSPRREAILARCREWGMKVENLFGVYGAERDRYIARSRVVLCMHYADGGIFESVRVAYLLANRKAVVCEFGRGLGETMLVSGVFPSTYERLPQACATLVKSDERRRATERTGFRVIRQLPESVILKSALDMPR